MTRLIALLSVLATPLAATADGAGHADRITWQTPFETAAVAIRSHGDQITWQFERAMTVAEVTKAVAPVRTGHADIITWACPEEKDLIN